MQANRHRELIPVPKGHLISLGALQPVAISCESGVLWITQDNDVRDVVLSAGEQFTSDRAGTVLVHALQPAVMTATSVVGRDAAVRAQAFVEPAPSNGWFRRLMASLEGRQPVTE